MVVVVELFESVVSGLPPELVVLLVAVLVTVTTFGPADEPQPAARQARARGQATSGDQLRHDGAQPNGGLTGLGRSGRFQCMTTITASQEQRVVEQVPKQLYIGGEWRARRQGDAARSRTPRPANRCARSPTPPPTTPRRRSTPPSTAGAGMEPAPAARARRDPPPRVRGDHRARGRAGAADDARDGQAAEGVEGRDRLRRRVPALVLRAGRPDRGPLRRRAERARDGC